MWRMEIIHGQNHSLLMRKSLPCVQFSGCFLWSLLGWDEGWSIVDLMIGYFMAFKRMLVGLCMWCIRNLFNFLFMNINQKMTTKKEDLKQTKMKREQKLLIITYDYRVFSLLQCPIKQNKKYSNNKIHLKCTSRTTSCREHTFGYKAIGKNKNNNNCFPFIALTCLALQGMSL